MTTQTANIQCTAKLNVWCHQYVANGKHIQVKHFVGADGNYVAICSSCQFTIIEKAVKDGNI